MKVTNLETSQKLKELGFKSNAGIKQYVGAKEFFGKGVSGKDMYYTGYLLETILEALPDKLLIHKDDPKHLTQPLFISKIGIGYDYQSGLTSIREGDESLANTAGRLLVKLLEDNIIKLGE